MKAQQQRSISFCNVCDFFKGGRTIVTIGRQAQFGSACDIDGVGGMGEEGLLRIFKGLAPGAL